MLSYYRKRRNFRPVQNFVLFDQSYKKSKKYDRIHVCFNCNHARWSKLIMDENFVFHYSRTKGRNLYWSKVFTFTVYAGLLIVMYMYCCGTNMDDVETSCTCMLLLAWLVTL